MSVWYVRDAVRNYLVNKLVGVRDIAASLALKLCGKKEPVKREMLMRENTVEQKMAGTALSPIQQKFEMNNAYIVAQKMIYNSLTSNRCGQEAVING